MSSDPSQLISEEEQTPILTSDGLEEIDIQSDSKSYQPATTPQTRQYQALSGLVWSSLGLEVLYALFTAESADQGLQNIFQYLLGQRDVSSGITLTPAIIMASLDLCTNILLFNPSEEALGVLGLSKDSYGQLQKEVKETRAIFGSQRHTPKSFAEKYVLPLFTRVIPVIMMAVNFPNGALADLLPIYNWINKKSPVAAYLVGALIITIGTSYYVALSSRDVIASADELIGNFSKSLVKQLYEENIGSALEATISSLNTHAFRATVFGFIAFQICQTVFHMDASDSGAKVISYLALVCAGGVSLLTRTKPAFDRHMKHYNLHLPGSKTPKDYVIDFAPYKQFYLAYLPGAMIGLVRGGSVAGLTAMALSKHLPAWVNGIISMVSFFAVGGHAFLANGRAELAKLAEKLYKEQQDCDSASGTSQQIEISSGTKSLALLINFGSQTARGFISVAAVMTMLADIPGGFLKVLDPKVAGLLGIWIGLENGLSNGFYFQEKAEKRIHQLGGPKGLAMLLWNAVSCAPCRGRNQQRGYSTLDSGSDSDTATRPRLGSTRSENSV